MSRTNTAAPPGLPLLTKISLIAGLTGGLLTLSPVRAVAQSSSGGISGTVNDATGAVVSGATVEAIQESTSSRRAVQSASDGSFTITTLTPGRYLVKASHRGFRPTELRDVVLNVDDRLNLRIELAIADVDEEVTVIEEVPRINTSPAVSTVIDRKFVENLPLNGRSFQALLQLTPGVVLTSANTNQEGGQFSINGQRTGENYFTVDGVSANAAASTSVGGFPGAAASGQMPTLTATGGTNGLVSVDALQEFRLQTSTYAAEFGRVPGGQIALVTRSGTNTFHGSAFEYFRDDALDATDWFVKRSGLPKAPLHQHNFGGVLGGPILRNRTFAFGSYEGLRLLLPQAKTTTVPTLDVRQKAAASIQPFLNAIPLPNGKDYGNGFADFTAVYSDPSILHATSVRVDHNMGSAVRLFGRFSDSRSRSETRIASFGYVNATRVSSKSTTAGATWVISDQMVHDLRANVTMTEAPRYSRQAPIGGATLLDLDPLPSGRDLSRTSLGFVVTGGGTAVWGPTIDFPERQINIVDSLTRTIRTHEIKIGLDYRASNMTAKGDGGVENYSIEPAGLPTGQLRQVSIQFRQPSDRTVRFHELSMYAQDHWRATSKVSLDYGVRWDVLPPPNVTSGVDGITLTRTDDLYNGGVGLAPLGTPAWKTRYTNVAPRVGGSFVVSDSASMPLVVKGGIGTFYGLGYGQVANTYGTAYPFTTLRVVPAIRFPANADVFVPPTFGVDAPSSLWVMDRDLRQPYTLQWNLTAEHGLGRTRSLSVGYIGANGHRLLKVDRYRVSVSEWPTTVLQVNVSRNVGYSDYHALQMQFHQRMSRSVQAIASYTFGRSRDTGSSDAITGVPADRLPPMLDYGNSTFDVRHVFSAAVTYQAPTPAGPAMWQALTRDWGIDAMIRSRSGYPLNVAATVAFPPDTQSVRANVVSGQPFWIDDSNAPAGKRLNRLAFQIPPAQTQGNLRRGTIRGFGLSQVDLAVRREFSVLSPVRLQIRLEAFNVFNTPNFADPNGVMPFDNFDVSTQMLNSGLQGQNALYQVGGPRSIQLAAKLTF